MKLWDIFLFDGMEDADKKRITDCLGIHSVSFSAGETAYDLSRDRDVLGIMISGDAFLARCDGRGNRTVIEYIAENDVFGQPASLSRAAEGLCVVCESDCCIAFVTYANIAKRCERACSCHSAAVENLFRGIAEKARRMSERIEVISNRSIRDKLMCLFEQFSLREGGRCFELPFSLSYLAEYICADRSAMMREIKNMSCEGLIRTDRRKIELL